MRPTHTIVPVSVAALVAVGVFAALSTVAQSAPAPESRQGEGLQVNAAPRSEEGSRHFGAGPRDEAHRHDESTRFGASVSLGEATATDHPSPCVVTSTARVSPIFPLLGEPVSGTLGIRLGCPIPVYPLHVMFVMDGTGRLSRRDQQIMRDSAIQVAEDVFAGDGEGVKVRAGVVVFDERARTYSTLTSDKNRVIGALRRTNERGGSAIDKGIAEAHKSLVRGRRLHDYPAEIHEVMLVFSCGPAEGDCPHALRAANNSKSQGVLMITVCVGAVCDAQCMRQLASSPRYFFQVENAIQLRRIFQRIRNELRDVVARSLTVTTTLSADLRLLTTDDERYVVVADPEAGVVTWSTDFVSSRGVTFELRVEPLRPGTLRLFENSHGGFFDNRTRSGSFEAPSEPFVVLRPVHVPVP